MEVEASKLVGFRAIYERLAQEKGKEILIQEPSKKGKTMAERKGFNMAFENGLTMSVQFGTHMHCDQNPDKHGFVKTAEIAVLKSDKGEFVTNDYIGTAGDGYVSPDDVAEIMYRVSKGIKLGERLIW